jgi:hypothetical protein
MLGSPANLSNSVCDSVMSPKARVNRRVTLARRDAGAQPNFTLDRKMTKANPAALANEQRRVAETQNRRVQQTAEMTQGASVAGCALC